MKYVYKMIQKSEKEVEIEKRCKTYIYILKVITYLFSFADDRSPDHFLLCNYEIFGCTVDPKNELTIFFSYFDHSS